MRDFLTWLWEHLLDLLPFVLVNEWERGILVRIGRIRHDLGPGLHFRVPLIDQTIIEPCTEQTVNLPDCSITTTDGATVVLSANVSYRITDLRKLWQSVTDFDESIGNLLLGALAHEGSARSWGELQHERKRVQRITRGRLSKVAKEWGVEVTRLHLTDFVKARPFKVFGGIGV